jgi:hypothetical protein
MGYLICCGLFKEGPVSTPSDLITQAEAARLSGRTIPAINELVRRGRIASFEMYGKRLVSKAAVLSFEPDKGGRPPKPKVNGARGKQDGKK